MPMPSVPRIRSNKQLNIKAQNGGNLVKYQNPAGPILYSPVDTRSDTTRKGYHEGPTYYGRDYRGPLGTAEQFLDTYAKDHNPNLITGVAPNPWFKKGVLDPKADARFIKWLNKRTSGNPVVDVEKKAERFSEMTKGGAPLGVDMERYNGAVYPHNGDTWKQVGKKSNVPEYEPTHITPEYEKDAVKRTVTGIGQKTAKNPQYQQRWRNHGTRD